MAIPHEWNIKWNTHARQMCVNTYDEGCLNIMTDFSAILDHDVQDKLNTAIPCHSNQCVVLATHSPRHVTVDGADKRVQMNDVWHFWSAQGGTLEANNYYHSVVMKNLLEHYSYLSLEQLNIFTDGCAEQYKSRRNAYLIGDIVTENNILARHNYAPTASFKTMVAAGDLLDRINYFKELFSDSGDHQKIVAVPSETVKQLKRDFVHECSINRSLNRIAVMKGEWCITLRFMQCVDDINKEYTIPLRAKELKAPILNVCQPHDSNVPFNLISTSRTVEVTNGQSLIY